MGLSSASGEDNALGGYVYQYLAAAHKLYSALQKDNFRNIKFKNAQAGQLDDFNIIFQNRVDAYQVKSSQFPKGIAKGEIVTHLKNLYFGWESLKRIYNDKPVNAILVSNNYLSSRPFVTNNNGNKSHIAEFFKEYWDVEQPSLEVESKWSKLLDELKEHIIEFESFRKYCHFELGTNFGNLTNEDVNNENSLITTLAEKLYFYSSNNAGEVTLNKYDVLRLAGWEDRFRFKNKHVFPVVSYYAPIETTVKDIRNFLAKEESGYLALKGTPGSGKSTLLTRTLDEMQKVNLVKYYCYIPNDSTQSRSEGHNFLHDITLKLDELHDVNISRASETSIEQLKHVFEKQLQVLQEQYQSRQILTVILIDGLDHIKRESQPVYSLINVLPHPLSIPAGVVFILGSQSYESIGLSREIQAQLKDNRTIEISPLSKNEVMNVIQQKFGSDQLVDSLIDEIYECSSGHPLYLNYIINYIDEQIQQNKEVVLSLLPPYSDNIENMYKAYWNSLITEPALVDLFGLMSRSRGVVNLKLLANSFEDKGEKSIALLKKNAHHLFIWHTAKICSFFHNSFKQFVLQKTQLDAFDEPDNSKNKAYHIRLADIVLNQDFDKALRCDYIYHKFCAEDYISVVSIANQQYFRDHFFEGRSYKDIKDDFYFVLQALQKEKNYLAGFKLALIWKELAERNQAISQLDLELINLKVYCLEENNEELQTFINKNISSLDSFTALKAVDFLCQREKYEDAKKVFDLCEPTRILNQTEVFEGSDEQINILCKWIEVAVFLKIVH